MTKEKKSHDETLNEAEIAAPGNGWQQERQELVETVQRLQAEFDNYKRRTEKEREEQCSFANADLLAELFPLMDNFELALSHANEQERNSPFFKGVELLYAQVANLLEHHGIVAINPLNGQFDPRQHEALLTEVRDASQKNTILEVLQKGYSLNGRVLRTAKVKVAK